MAVIVLTDVAITINAVNMSPFCTSATITITADELESTAFGATYKARVAGLKDWKLDLEFNEDFAAGAVDQTIYPLLGTSTAVTMKSTSGANATTNPQYTGNVLVASYTPIDGGVGALGKTKVSWNGNGALSRATS